MGKKTAIVTGASRGIGYAIARQLGLDGYQVVMLATGAKEKYAEAFEKLTEQDITWHYVQGSIDCAQDRRRLLDETLARFGRVDVLVNNAGVAPLERKDILEMSEESFDRVMGINTKGTLVPDAACGKPDAASGTDREKEGDDCERGLLFRESFLYLTGRILHFKGWCRHDYTAVRGPSCTGGNPGS